MLCEIKYQELKFTNIVSSLDALVCFAPLRMLFSFQSLCAVMNATGTGAPERKAPRSFPHRSRCYGTVTTSTVASAHEKIYTGTSIQGILGDLICDLLDQRPAAAEPHTSFLRSVWKPSAYRVKPQYLMQNQTQRTHMSFFILSLLLPHGTLNITIPSLATWYKLPLTLLGRKAFISLVIHTSLVFFP